MNSANNFILNSLILTILREYNLTLINSVVYLLDCDKYCSDRKKRNIDFTDEYAIRK